MSRYDREERDYSRGRDDDPTAEVAPEAGSAEFPWKADNTAADTRWREQEWDQTAPEGEPMRVEYGAPDRGVLPAPQPSIGMAVVGLVFAIVALIPIPIINIILWGVGVIFSWMGLRRATKQGRGRKVLAGGLAVAGLAISVVNVLIWVFLIVAFTQF